MKDLLKKYSSSFFCITIFLLSLDAKAGDLKFEIQESADNFFNDSTPVAPIDGNIGETLGEQRLLGLLFAMDYIEKIFLINTDIDISIGFNENLSQSSTLATCGPIDFSEKNNINNLPYYNYTYPNALANQYAGFDVDQTENEMELTIYNGADWYYGFNSKADNQKTHFVGVMIHEILHGLGFLGSFNDSGIEELQTIYNEFLNDTYLYNYSFTWVSYNPWEKGQVLYSYYSDKLWWGGATTINKIQDIALNSSRTVDYDQYFRPPMQLKSSNPTKFVAHHFWDGLQHNHEIMEPNAYPDNPFNHIGLAKYILIDIGWPIHPNGDKPHLSIMDDEKTSLNQFPQAESIMEFSVWDNDNEMHLVRDYGSNPALNPWYDYTTDRNPIYVGTSATSSNQDLVRDSNLSIYCSYQNDVNDVCSVQELYYIPEEGASGETTITVTALDVDGNTDTQSFILNITPNTLPEINFSSPSDGHEFLTDIQSFSALASDAEDGILSIIDWSIRLPGYAWQYDNNNKNTNWSTELSDGNYEVRACVTDSDGNSNCSAINIFVSADADPDNDGIKNSNELLIGTDPYNNDTDGDGLLDGDDPSPLEPEPITIEIPFMGGIGLLALGLSMLGLGAVRLRRK